MTPATTPCYIHLRVESGHKLSLWLTRQPLVDRNPKESDVLYNGEDEGPGALRRLTTALVKVLRKNHSLLLSHDNPGLSFDDPQMRRSGYLPHELVMQFATEISHLAHERIELMRRAHNKKALLDAYLKMEHSRSAPSAREHVRRRAGRQLIAWSMDPDGRCTFANGAWQQYSGYTGQGDLYESWESAVHPEDRPSVVASYRAALAARAHYVAEYRLRRASGKYGWVRSEADPHYSLAGVFLGHVGTTFEILRSRKKMTAVEKTA